jgi:hypothetical protein
MAHKFTDRTQQFTTSTGLAFMLLAAAVPKMRSFNVAGYSIGDTFWGLIEHQDPNIYEWEINLLTIGDGGGGNFTISRGATPISSSNNNALVDFSAGTKYVACVAPASKIGLADNVGSFILPGPVQTTGIFETSTSPTIASGVLSLNLLAASVFQVALNANVTTLTFANMIADKAASFLLEFTADGTPRTVAQPGSVVPMTGSYTPSSANGKKDRLLYETIDGGTTWRMWIVFLNQ